jgi:hypothetical protein
MKSFLLAVLLGLTISATAQRIPRLNDVQDLRQRLNALNLTIEQKRRITNLIRRERLQYYMNQREMNQILTDKQKAMLLQWRKERQGNKTDSTTSLN